MKKVLCFILAALMLLCLCACGECSCDECACGEQPQTENPPQTDPSADPPQNDLPADLPPEPEPDEPAFETIPGAYDEPEYGSFVYNGLNPTMNEAFDHSVCRKGSLYYIHLETEEIFLITNEEIIAETNNSTHIFYVKKAEPTKIYATPVENLSVSDVIYETELGEINYIDVGLFQHRNTALQIVEDNRRLVWIDLLTNESEVLMEQYYITRGTVTTDRNFYKMEDDYLYLLNLNVILFHGKMSEEDTDVKLYQYYRDSGYCFEVRA